jgi:4-hydroxybenzoate polyprenyltransferase
MIMQDLKISRPSRWLLLLGSFMIGALASDTSNFFWPALAVFAFYFTFPANLLIYGVNDIFDQKADQHNKDKTNLVTPDNRLQIVNLIILWNLPFFVVWLADEMPTASKWALLGFVFFGIFYSAWPIRARSKPILDSFFNILYVFPGLFAYGLLEYKFPPWQIIVAATLWAAAVHAYSAIPKAAANKKAGVNTIATFLHPIGTLMFCLACFAGSAALSYPWLKMFSLGIGLLYLFIILITFVRTDPAKQFFLYKAFPYINILVAIGLGYYIATVIK